MRSVLACLPRFVIFPGLISRQGHIDMHAGGTEELDQLDIAFSRSSTHSNLPPRRTSAACSMPAQPGTPGSRGLSRCETCLAGNPHGDRGPARPLADEGKTSSLLCGAMRLPQGGSASLRAARSQQLPRRRRAICPLGRESSHHHDLEYRGPPPALGDVRQ
jgi:hypothetical protein